MGVTIYDIAAQADVSIATVSRVFNGSPRVSESTRARVEGVADALGYRPHALAQGLARKSTGVVSAVIPVLTNDFYMEVLRGIQDAVCARGLDLLVYSALMPEEVDSQLGRALQRGRADGMLLLSTPVDDVRAAQLEAGHQPIVLVDAAHPAFDSFTVDNVEGGYLAARHLIDAGYQRVALLSVSPEPPPARERREGYERALRESGRTPEVYASAHRPYGFSEEAGYEVMQEIIAGGNLPDALFAASDLQAPGVLSALQDAGLSAPADIALVGFDDVRVATFARLSTIRQPMYTMGHAAADRLLDRLDTPSLPPTARQFQPKLVIRATSECAAFAPKSSPQHGKTALA